jgi:type I restriction enzyme, S subunit
MSDLNTSHYNRVMPGDIVYTKSPTGDFPLGIIKRSAIDETVIVSPLYGVFTPATPYVGVILDVFFESPINTKNYLAALVQKGAKNTIAITNKRFLEGRFKMPSDINEQAKLAEIVTTAKAELGLFLKKKELLQHQKRALMQMLLTGRLRVSQREGEIDVETRVTEEAAQ